MASVQIRGIDYKVKNTSNIILSPLLSLLAVKPEESESEEAFGLKMFDRIKDPASHDTLAYTLVKCLDGVPQSIASYDRTYQPDGSYKVVSNLTLDAEEIMPVLMEIIALSGTKQGDVKAIGGNAGVVEYSTGNANGNHRTEDGETERHKGDRVEATKEYFAPVEEPKTECEGGLCPIPAPTPSTERSNEAEEIDRLRARLAELEGKAAV